MSMIGRWGRAAVSVMLVAVLLATSDIDTIGDTLTGATPTLVLCAFVAFALSNFAAVLKWKLSLPGAPLPLLSRTYLASMFYSVLPTGQLGGEARKLLLARSQGLTLAKVAGSIVFDKLTSLVPLTAIGAIALAFGSAPESRAVAPLLGLATVLLIAGLLGLPVIARLAATLQPNRIFRWLEGFSAPLNAMTAQGPLVAISLGAGAIVQGLLIAIYVLAAGALNLNYTLPDLIGAVALANLAAVLPVSVAGIGVREVSLAAILAWQGIPVESAVALSVICLALFFVGAAIGFLAELLPDARSAED